MWKGLVSSFLKVNDKVCCKSRDKVLALVTKTVSLEMQQEKPICDICGNQPAVTCSELSLTPRHRSGAMYFQVQYYLNG